MRKALWILSAPVVAGGLAWAVNAADEQHSLRARTPSAQAGKVVYFSRSGSSTAEAGASKGRAAAVSDDEESSDSASDSAATQRYVRNRANLGSSATARPKGRYQDLFGEATTETRQTAATAKKPVSTSAARAQQRRPIDECAVNEASPDAGAELPREENLLPPADDFLQLVQGDGEKDEVLHADHKTAAGSARGTVKHVQHVNKGARGKSRPADDLEDVLAPDADEFDAIAPPPAAAAKTVKPAVKKPAVPAPTPTRAAPTAAARTTKSAPAAAPPAAAAAKPRATRKAEIPAAAESEAPPSQGLIQQASAIASDTGDVPMISLKWVKNGEVNIGQESTCGLLVKNTGKLAARDIVVEAYFPETVQLRDAKPLPSDTKKRLAWVFDSLEPGEEKSIEITMIPGRAGDIATSATVRFSGVASNVLRVDEPQLNVTINGPHDAMVGEPIAQEIIVSNPGTGVARDVVINAILSDGLKHQRGKNVEIRIGSLGPGENRPIRFPLEAVSGGDATVKVEARGVNLVRKTQTQIKIAAPKLKVEVAGPALRYINRHAQFTITVTNDGVAATDNVRIVHLIPEGFEFVKADRGGTYDTVTASTTWFIGRLEAGQSIQVSSDLNARQIGDYQHHVQASGENGTVAAARLDTKIDGASAVVMEVADLDDPVEIETQTAYEITIRNNGSKASQNLRLACELPQGVALIDTDGPTPHALERGTLVFRPLGELAAGSKVVYRVKVNGKVAGNLRLRALLTTGSTKEPLIVEEMTKFYAD